MLAEFFDFRRWRNAIITALLLSLAAPGYILPALADFQGMYLEPHVYLGVQGQAAIRVGDFAYWTDPDYRDVKIKDIYYVQEKQTLLCSVWMQDDGEGLNRVYRWDGIAGKTELVSSNAEEYLKNGFIPDVPALPYGKADYIFEQNALIFALDFEMGICWMLKNENWNQYGKLNCSTISSKTISGLRRFIIKNNQLFCMDSVSAELLCINLNTGELEELAIGKIEDVQPYLKGLLIQKNSGLYQYDPITKKMGNKILICDRFASVPQELTIYYTNDNQLYSFVLGQEAMVIQKPAVMERIDQLLALPNGNVALVQNDMGISIVNPELPSRTLRVDKGLVRAMELYREFSLSHPNIQWEEVETGFELVDSSDLSFYDLRKNLENGAKIIDLFPALYDGDTQNLIEEGFFADLSNSTLLESTIHTLLPQLQEITTQKDNLIAFPRSISIVAWMENSRLIQSYPHIKTPQNLDEFEQLPEFLLNQLWAENLPEEFASLLWPYPEVWVSWYASQSLSQYDETKKQKMQAYDSIFENMTGIIWNPQIQYPDEYPSFLENGWFYSGVFALDAAGLDEYTLMSPPVIEKEQNPRVLGLLDLYVVNRNGENIDEAICYLEFVATYQNPIVKYMTQDMDEESLMGMPDEICFDGSRWNIMFLKKRLKEYIAIAPFIVFSKEYYWDRYDNLFAGMVEQ